MSLDRFRLWPLFFICLIFFLTFPTILPKWRLLYFTPFFVISCYKLNLFDALSLAIAIGFIYDIYTPEAHFGITSFAFSLSILLVYQQKKRFFKDNLTTLPLMSFYFSATASFFLMFFREREILHHLSMTFILTEFVIMPLWDTLYAFCFLIPFLLVFGRPKKGSDYFLSSR